MQNPLEREKAAAIPKERKTREVSRYAFPYYDLESSIEIAKKLHDRAGGKASIIQLASYLGHKDEFSGAYRSKLWGAKLFGLITIDGNEISITPLGEQLAGATVGIQRDTRLAEAFLNVPLFREIYRRYESSTLPSSREGQKKALLETFGVSSQLVSLALKSFERSAEQAGFKREGLNRLIHPVPVGLLGKDSLAESKSQEPEEPKPVSGNIPAADVTQREAISQDIHPAIKGFLRELPSKDKQWAENERQRWFDAFVAIIKALYPTSEESTKNVNVK